MVKPAPMLPVEAAVVSASTVRRPPVGTSLKLLCALNMRYLVVNQGEVSQEDSFAQCALILGAGLETGVVFCNHFELVVFNFQFKVTKYKKFFKFHKQFYRQPATFCCVCHLFTNIARIFC